MSSISRERRLIWVLEDEQGSRFVVERTLGLRYRLRHFESIQALLGAIHDGSEKPGLLIADLYVQDGCFVDFLREKGRQVLEGLPFLIVSSVDDLDVLRFCFDVGARDYLVKPFQRNELVAKVERWLAPMAEIRTDPMRGLDLTSKEREILEIFLVSKECRTTREEILKRIWDDVKVAPKTVDVHLANLRRKLEASGAEIRSTGVGEWTLVGRPFERASGDRVNLTVGKDLSHA